MPVTGKCLEGLVILACCCAFILFGYDQGVLSGLVSTSSFLTEFGNPSPGLLGTIVAIYDVGCAIGSIATIWIGDRLGRRRTIFIGGILICLGTALQASAFSVPHMIVGRIITVPIYQAEMSESSQRGAAVMAEVSFVIFGIAFSNWIDFAFVFGGKVHGSAIWRIPIALQAVFPIMTFIILPFIPESPRWLAFKGLDSQVQDCLARLAGGNARPYDEDIEEKARIIINTANSEAEITDFWLDIFKTGEQQNLRRMILGVMTQLIQQFTCINGVVYYGPAIFSQSLGMDAKLAAIVGGCGSICFWIGSILPIFFIERLGRRHVMLHGLFMTVIALAGLTVATAFAQYSAHQRAAGFGALACLLVYQFCYGASWAGVPWVHAPEINSLRMRNRGSAIASAAEWIGAFLVVEVTPSGVANLTWKYYLIWILVSVIGYIFIYVCYPETSGASLEDMDLYFLEQRSWNILHEKSIKASLLGDYRHSASGDESKGVSLQHLE
ncbi:sugar transporter STL1 [Penicillium hetheringtonii]|uniref:Sugar transporter STL1 n=1 Tax=Penicillium hetheringtonii TaxID=911720 RepID=A0AAD6DQ98_9EURO|nr:sugar transporter STL1 [Penicillium hetheringtonii]